MGMLDGKVALVTGAGGGLGRAHAMLLAKEGASVVVNDLGGSRDGSGAGHSMADGVVDEIKAAGGKAVAHYGSVTEKADAQGMVQTAVDNFGKLDILIANAGILRDKSFKNMEDDMWDIVINVHLRGTYLTTKAAFDHMVSRGEGGRIIVTSSTSGLLGNFGQTNYGAAKMGLVGLSNVLAVEGAKNNIKSNVIAPIARTRLTEDLLGPMAEHVKPECVTPLVVYLCSEQCEETHSIYSVGGGRFARIFIGMAKGWFAGTGAVPSAEEVAAHWDQIHSDADYEIPDSIAGEMKALLEAFKG